MNERDFYQPITPGGGNYAITGPLGAPIYGPTGGFSHYAAHVSRGHARGQRFISTYRYGRDGARSKYLPHQGKSECARRAGGD